MGKVAKVNRLVVMIAVVGRFWRTLERAALAYSSVWNISTFQSKKRETSAEPREVVDRTVSNPGTLLTASSMGLVMATCICSTGMTPLSTPMTTRGKFVSGNTEIGTWNAAYAPATNRATTRKKTVRNMRESQ